jgi:hypothetical protein
MPHLLRADRLGGSAGMEEGLEAEISGGNIFSVMAGILSRPFRFYSAFQGMTLR